MSARSDLLIAPSLVSAPMTHLARTLAELTAADADMLHFDLEDGHFVPVMNLGTRLIEELRPLTDLPFDVHLMTSDPEALIPVVADLGADRIAFHYEATPYPRRTLRQVKTLGKKAGLAFNPRTPLPELEYLLPYLDYLVLLTTEPEMPDCPFLPAILDKVRAAAHFARQQTPGLDIVADGGLDAGNVAMAVVAGANVVVSGRGIFKDGQIEKNMRDLRLATSRQI